MLTLQIHRHRLEIRTYASNSRALEHFSTAIPAQRALVKWLEELFAKQDNLGLVPALSKYLFLRHYKRNKYHLNLFSVIALLEK